MCSYDQNNAPWLVLGDFNIIKSSEDKVGGSEDIPNAVVDFRNSLSSAELADLRYSGIQNIALE
jgi:hypothetical protein